MGKQQTQILYSATLPINAKIKALSKSIFTKLHKYSNSSTLCGDLISATLGDESH